MLRTPEGRLAILDFGLMTQVTDDQKYGMIEAIAHLLNRDYEEIVQDFVTLEFIPPETDIEELKKELLPALSNVFDQALSGGGAKVRPWHLLRDMILERAVPLDRRVS